MRIFPSFNPEGTCPLCKTSEDRPCFLAPVDGTEDDGICEAKQVHVDCAVAWFRIDHAGRAYLVNE